MTDYSNPQSGIALLVNAMTSTRQIRLIGSCDGQQHILGATPPYVHFKCSEDVASRLADALAGNDCRSTLSYDWDLVGIFQPGHALCFHLTFTGRWFSRRKVERDIVLLSELFSRVG